MIYFLSAPQVGRVKIGTSDEPERRVAEVHLMCPVPVELLGTFFGDRHDERVIHNRLAHLRRHGEWFEDCEELRAVMIEAVARSLVKEHGAERMPELVQNLAHIIKEREAA